MNLDFVSGPDRCEQLFQVLLRHSNASMGSSFSDRLRSIRPVDSVPLLIEADPAIAQRIFGARSDYLPRVVVGRVLEAIDDLEFPGGTWRRLLSDCDRIDLLHRTVFEDCELAIGDADDDLPPGRGLCPQPISHQENQGS